MIRKKKAESEAIAIHRYNIWRCEACEVMLDYPEMMEHMKGVHKIAQPVGTREVLVDGDSKSHSIRACQWTIGGLKFQQISIYKRKKPKAIVSSMFQTRRKGRGKKC